MSTKPWWHGMAFDSAAVHPDPKIRAAAAQLGHRGGNCRIDKSKCRRVPAKGTDIPTTRRRMALDEDTPAARAMLALLEYCRANMEADAASTAETLVTQLMEAMGDGKGVAMDTAQEIARRARLAGHRRMADAEARMRERFPGMGRLRIG